jgi:hypothetical protein
MKHENFSGKRLLSSTSENPHSLHSMLISAENPHGLLSTSADERAEPTSFDPLQFEKNCAWKRTRDTVT